MTRTLSGIQPSGVLHLGNYFGAMKQHIEASKSASREKLDALFFIADLHALTTVHDKKQLEENVRSVAASYIALGLDTKKSVFFRQSDVPEVTELMWLLLTVTGVGLLERGHSYKDKVARGLTPSAGLFTYPALMAADILAYDSTRVPVGQDQLQHIEFAQDMCTHFNTTYGGSFLVRPEPSLAPTATVPGVDGAKMSKSYGNTIDMFDANPEKAAKKIVTDSRAPEEPKNPDELNIYKILALFLNDAEKADWRARLEKGGVGYGAMKKEVGVRMEAMFGEARKRHHALMTTAEGQREIEDVLREGAAIARGLERATLARCYDAVGMPNAAARLR